MDIDHDLVFASESPQVRNSCEALAHLLGWNGEHDRCRGCNGIVDYFDDELSLKEYYISGLCQSCQDEIFSMEFVDG